MKTLETAATFVYQEHVRQTKDPECLLESFRIKVLEGQNVSSDEWASKLYLIKVAVSSAYLLIPRREDAFIYQRLR